MKYITIIMLLLTNIVFAESFHDTTIEMDFESVNMSDKTITFNGFTYKYEMIGYGDSYLLNNFKPKSLKYLKKNEKVFVTIRVEDNGLKGSKNIMTDTVVYVGKVRDGY